MWLPRLPTSPVSCPGQRPEPPSTGRELRADPSPGVLRALENQSALGFYSVQQEITYNSQDREATSDVRHQRSGSDAGVQTHKGMLLSCGKERMSQF